MNCCDNEMEKRQERALLNDVFSCYDCEDTCSGSLKKTHRVIHLVAFLSLVAVLIGLFIMADSQNTYVYAKDKNPLCTEKVDVYYKGNKVRLTYKYRKIEPKDAETAYKVESASFKVLKKKNKKLRNIEIKTWAVGVRYNENKKKKGFGKSKYKTKTFHNVKEGRTYKLASNQYYYYCPDPGRSTINYWLWGKKKSKDYKTYTYGWGSIDYPF